MSTGLLLIAHGARDAAWAAPLHESARLLAARRPEAQVRLAFLEFQPPSPADAAAELVRSGCTDVHLLPLFLGAAGHVRKDLPPLLDALRAAHPQLRWALHGAAGGDAGVIAALAAWADHASQGPP